MKRTLGLILVVLGVVVLVVQGISFTTEEEVLDVGPLEVTREDRKTIPLSPILGGAALLGGAVLVASSRSRA